MNELIELYNKILSIATDVSLIRDVCNCAIEDGTKLPIRVITRRSTEATDKLFKLLDELGSKIRNNKE